MKNDAIVAVVIATICMLIYIWIRFLDFRFATSAVVAEKALKEKIIGNTGAYCTEMEGAAIAHAAWRNEVPFVVIRAISDKADDSAHMDYPTFEAQAAKRSAAVTAFLAKTL